MSAPTPIFGVWPETKTGVPAEHVRRSRDPVSAFQHRPNLMVRADIQVLLEHRFEVLGVDQNQVRAELTRGSREPRSGIPPYADTGVPAGLARGSRDLVETHEQRPRTGVRPDIQVLLEDPIWVSDHRSKSGFRESIHGDLASPIQVDELGPKPSFPGEHLR